MKETSVMGYISSKSRSKNVDVRTFQELTLVGHTFVPDSENPSPISTAAEFFIPREITAKHIAVEKMRKLRKQRLFFCPGQHLNSSLGFNEVGYIALSLEDLDPTTGQTIRDPKVLGFINTRVDEIYLRALLDPIITQTDQNEERTILLQQLMRDKIIHIGNLYIPLLRAPASQAL